MEYLIKQTRAKPGGTRQDTNQERNLTGDAKLPPQKTESLKDKKRRKSWIQRQFSRQSSWDEDFSASDYPTAIAAAAYAVQSLEESKSRDHKQTTNYSPNKSLNNMKSKTEETKIPNEPRKGSIKFPDERSKKSFKDPDIKKVTENAIDTAPSIKKKGSFADANLSIGAINKEPERVDPSIKRAPTFPDKDLTINIESKKNETRKRDPTKRGPEDSMADAWEKEEMARIHERYAKVRATIENWESKKKKKAKLKIHRIEAELDKKRVKSMSSYRSKTARIEAIAGGAKAKAEENQRHEEFKAKEKANKIKLTGKIPATCMCF